MEASLLPPGGANHNQAVVDTGSRSEGQGEFIPYVPKRGNPQATLPYVPPQGVLRPGWTEYVDGQTGDTYYFHQATGETSWDRPI